jgi:opacity protein-like surface antigen
MKKLSPIKLAAFAAFAAAPFALSVPAMAQDAPQTEVYVGAQGGYHDLGNNPLGKDGSPIYGLFAGVDVPVGPTLIVGAEGNFNLGSGIIDSEYGATGKIGVRVGQSGQIFARGGYQWVDVDVRRATGVNAPAGFDDTSGDYLVGVGAQYKIGTNTALRVTADTLGFDTTRVTGGLAFNF